jgi:hypothetical protein
MFWTGWGSRWERSSRDLSPIREPLVPQDRRVGLVFDDRYLTHNTGLHLIEDRFLYPFAEPVAHPSIPALVGRAKHLMDLFGSSERMARIEPVIASDEQLTVCHTPRHLARVAEIAGSVKKPVMGEWSGRAG